MNTTIYTVALRLRRLPPKTFLSFFCYHYYYYYYDYDYDYDYYYYYYYD